MIRAEWMFNMQSGPVVGSADCRHVTEAWETVKAAFRDAVGDRWGAEHAEAVQRLEQVVMWDSRDALAERGRWEHRVPGVSVVLTRSEDGP